MRMIFSLEQSIFSGLEWGLDWLLKILASLEFQTEANRAPHTSPEKLLCSRLKNILITFRYKQYRNNYSFDFGLP